MVLGIRMCNALVNGFKKAINEKLEGFKNDTSGKGEGKS
jgi:hypothetical protein